MRRPSHVGWFGCRNLDRLTSFFERHGIFLLTPQRDEVYEKIEGFVEAAAQLKAEEDTEGKKIYRDNFRDHVLNLGQQAQNFESPVVSHDALKRKLYDASLDPASVENAISLRLDYLNEQFQARYLDPSRTELTRVRRQVVATLQEQKAWLETSALTMSGPDFHRQCIDEMRELQKILSKSNYSDIGFLQGCMYDVTGRCRHHFVRSSK